MLLNSFTLLMKQRQKMKKKRNISQTINLDPTQGFFSLCSFQETLVWQNSTLFKYLQEKFWQNLFYIFSKTWNSFSCKWYRIESGNKVVTCCVILNTFQCFVSCNFNIKRDFVIKIQILVVQHFALVTVALYAKHQQCITCQMQNQTQKKVCSIVLCLGEVLI